MNKYKYLSIVLISLVIISGCKKDIETQTPAPVIANETKKLIKVPLTRQASGYTCGAAALQSILYYNGIWMLNLWIYIFEKVRCYKTYK